MFLTKLGRHGRILVHDAPSVGPQRPSLAGKALTSSGSCLRTIVWAFWSDSMVPMDPLSSAENISLFRFSIKLLKDEKKTLSCFALNLSVVK